MENKINQAVRGTSEPSVFRGCRGWKSSNFSPLPVEGEIFCLTFPFIEQAIVIDSIEKFLQVEVYHPAVAFGNVLLCLVYRLLRATPRSKTVAVFGERRVPAFLQNLQHCLLNKTIQDSGDSQRGLHMNAVNLWAGLRSSILSTRFVAKASRY
jgi:hypothetical protein